MHCTSMLMVSYSYNKVVTTVAPSSKPTAEPTSGSIAEEGMACSDIAGAIPGLEGYANGEFVECIDKCIRMKPYFPL